MATTTPQKCAQDGCTCMAQPGRKYCSTHCEDAKKFMTLTCHAGIMAATRLERSHRPAGWAYPGSIS